MHDNTLILYERVLTMIGLLDPAIIQGTFFCVSPQVFLLASELGANRAIGRACLAVDRSSVVT